MRFRHWLLLSESDGIVPWWYHGEENPIPDWAQDVPTYHRGLVTMDKRYPGFLDLNPPEFYAHPDRQVWHTPDGELAYSLVPHDGKREIAGVYNLGGKRRAGQGRYAVRRAFTQGGDQLHAFEGGRDFSLPHYYHNAVGAMPTAFFPFDPKLAHPRWNYEKYGRPGLVQLQIPPEAHKDLDRWLRQDHAELSRDEFQDRLHYLKRMALGSDMKENQEPIKPGRMSREEYDRLVQGVDDIYFGGAEPDPDDNIGRFIQMQSEQNGISINEAAERSMARLFGQLEENPSTVVIMTAFRGERPLSQNRALNKNLAADIRRLGWGYTPVLGGFVEKTSDGKENRVHEESFFINANGSPKQVTTLVLRLLAKYEQEAALIKLPEQPDAMLMFQNGSTTSVGRWQADPQQMATYYTRMRSGPAGRQFTFEAAGDDSLMARMAVDKYFKRK